MLDDDQQVRFTQLWTEALPTVSRFVASLIRDQWAVRDIVQNTSLALLRKFSEYDVARPFLPWALGIANFEILGYQRDVARSRIVSDTKLLERYAQTWAEVAPRLDGEATALQHCVGELKGRPRQVIELSYAQDQPSEAIGRELNLTAANVRTILKRTREALKRCVERQLALRGGST